MENEYSRKRVYGLVAQLVSVELRFRQAISELITFTLHLNFNRVLSNLFVSKLSYVNWLFSS